MLQLWYMEEVVEKAHKYIKRVPTGKPKPKYRYFYKMPKGGLVTKQDLVVGSSFQYGNGEERSHYSIKKVEGDNITVSHSESKETRTVSFAQLKDLLDTDRLQQANPSKQEKPQSQQVQKEKPSESEQAQASKPSQGKNNHLVQIETIASFLKKQLQSYRDGAIDHVFPMPPDTQSMGQVKTKNELFATGNPRMLGKGEYAEVFEDAGPPPRAYKYGEVSEEDFIIGAVAGYLGIGAKIIAGQVGMNSIDANKEGRVEMEFLENHKTVWSTFIDEGHMDEWGRMSERPETIKAYGELSKKALQKLQILHLAGYSHNDAHFGNLLIAPDGELKLIDYGLARKGYKTAYGELFNFKSTQMFQALNGVRDGMADEVFELLRNLKDYVSKNVPKTGDTSATYAQAVLMFHNGLNQIMGEKELI